jgi:hypothetical protein
MDLLWFKNVGVLIKDLHADDLHPAGIGRCGYTHFDLLGEQRRLKITE